MSVPLRDGAETRSRDVWTYATRGGHAGGIVVVDRIAFFGAIGVAGAHHPDQDILCAQAALAVLEGAHH